MDEADWAQIEQERELRRLLTAHAWLQPLYWMPGTV